IYKLELKTLCCILHKIVDLTGRDQLYFSITKRVEFFQKYRKKNIVFSFFVILHEEKIYIIILIQTLLSNDKLRMNIASADIHEILHNFYPLVKSSIIIPCYYFYSAN